MRRDIISDVEIKDPPIEELTRKYSAFSSIKRSCIGGCGCFVFFIVLIIVLLKLWLGAGPQNVSAVPNDFPQDVAVYDQQNIDEIIYINGKYKNRAISASAFFPKIILSPLISALDSSDVNASLSASPASFFKNMWKVVNSQVSDSRSIVKIKWKDLPANPEFIYAHLKTELQKENFIVENDYSMNNSFGFSFKKDNHSGTFQATGIQGQSGTVMATLIVNY
ncbi:MAG: hypothetical protein ABH832_02310 [bacterium]